MRHMLMGSRPFFAPNDDQGASPDADEDDLEAGAAGPEGDLDPDEDEFDDPDADAGEPEDDLDAAPPVDEPAPSRGASRIQTLNERARQAEERVARMEQEMAALRETRQQSQQLEHQRQEQERLALMSSEERLEYRMSRELAEIRMQTWDANDRVAFNAMAADNPAVAALKDEVEQQFRAMAAQGRHTDRATIATFLIGQKALAKAPRGKAAGRRASEAGRERQAARPSSGRGDVPAARGRSQQSLAERLKDIEI